MKKIISLILIEKGFGMTLSEFLDDDIFIGDFDSDI